MKSNSSQYIVVSILGQDQPGVVHEVSKLAATCSCNIKESRMTNLGNAFGLLMLLSGSWDSVAKFESSLPSLAKHFEWQTLIKRTALAQIEEKLLPYTVQVVALDNVGLVQVITGFFSEQNINIRELYTTTYPASHTGTLMFSLTMAVNIPAAVSLADLRERFILFCDELNLDAIIEPEKG